MKSATDPCQKQACAIQKCLQANNYKEEACTSFIKEMLKCCEKWKTMSGCCDGFLKEEDAKRSAGPIKSTG